MKLHIVGGGGRVHALTWKLAQSPEVISIVCAPGNAGISMERLRNGERAISVPISSTDICGQLALAGAVDADLTIVSEDDPLALGIVDLFQRNGRRIWGPTKQAARFEWSKVWAFEFMQRHGIPVPYGRAFENATESLHFARTGLNFECAIKIDGLASGKGVFLCRSEAQVNEALTRIFVHKEFGDAGRRVLIQELVHGKEISLHYLCSGKSAVAFPSSKDHKRLLDGDEGSMTGGMGAISPSPDITPEAFDKLAKQIIEPWLAGCEAEGIDFRGILYPGVILSKDGPKVLEFNTRFGDPEAQVYLPRLQNNLLELIEGSLEGRELTSSDLKWSSDTAVCIVMASPGYPGKYEKRKRIIGLEAVERHPNTKVFHAGTTVDENGHILTNGGRVLGVTAWGPTLNKARERVYQGVHKIKFDGGAHFRRTIGARQ